MIGPIGVSGSLLQKQGHRIFIGGEEVKQRADCQACGQAVESFFIAGHCAAIHKNVESWIFSLDDDVKARSHNASVKQLEVAST